MIVIYRGTTHTIEVELPFEIKYLAEAYVSISQNEEIVLDKKLSECSCDGEILTVKFSQEETLSLDCRCKAEMQIRAKTLEGDAFATDPIRVHVGRILKDGVI